MFISFHIHLPAYLFDEFLTIAVGSDMEFFPMYNAVQRALVNQ